MNAESCESRESPHPPGASRFKCLLRRPWGDCVSGLATTRTMRRPPSIGTFRRSHRPESIPTPVCAPASRTLGYGCAITSEGDTEVDDWLPAAARSFRGITAFRKSSAPSDSAQAPLRSWLLLPSAASAPACENILDSPAACSILSTISQVLGGGRCRRFGVTAVVSGELGMARVSEIDSGHCKVSFPRLAGSTWSLAGNGPAERARFK
jgi:hypothetical protein